MTIDPFPPNLFSGHLNVLFPPLYKVQYCTHLLFPPPRGTILPCAINSSILISIWVLSPKLIRMSSCIIKGYDSVFRSDDSPPNYQYLGKTPSTTSNSTSPLRWDFLWSLFRSLYTLNKVTFIFIFFPSLIMKSVLAKRFPRVLKDP